MQLTFTARDLATTLPTLDESERAEKAKDALSYALLKAPCLGRDDLTQVQVDQAQAILRAAAERWALSTSPALADNVTVGPLHVGGGKAPERRGMFYPSEEDDLRTICSGTSEIRATTRWAIG